MRALLILFALALGYGSLQPALAKAPREFAPGVQMAPRDRRRVPVSVREAGGHLVLDVGVVAPAMHGLVRPHATAE